MNAQWDLYYWGCTSRPIARVEAPTKLDAEALGFEMFHTAVDADLVREA